MKIKTDQLKYNVDAMNKGTNNTKTWVSVSFSLGMKMWLIIMKIKKQTQVFLLEREDEVFLTLYF